MADQVEGERSEVAVYFRHLPALQRTAQQEIDIGPDILSVSLNP